MRRQLEVLIEVEEVETVEASPLAALMSGDAKVCTATVPTPQRWKCASCGRSASSADSVCRPVKVD